MSRFPNAQTRPGLSGAVLILLAASFFMAAADYVSAQSGVVLNEVMAHNLTVPLPEGRVADWVELRNLTPEAVDLGGMGLASAPNAPAKFVFRDGTTIPAGGFFLLRFDPLKAVSTTNAGRSLNASGDALYLLSSANLVLDSVQFGPQAADFSIGRVPATSPDTGDLWGDVWALTSPTPAAPNTPVALGPQAGLRINEWMAQENSDWFEIYNPGFAPVALSGLFLSDHTKQPRRFAVPPLSFIGVGPRGAYQQFIADEQTNAAPNHVNFKLASSGEFIGIGNGLNWVDFVDFGQQTAGASEGFLPDGGTEVFQFLLAATPGAPNRDPSRPTLAITAPTPNARTSNDTLLAYGTANDNFRVTQVWVGLNGGDPALAAGTTAWSLALRLLPGTNLLRAYAVDIGGNYSVTNQRTVVLARSDRLRVRVVGQGFLSTNYNNASLDINRGYSLTATPTNRHGFSHWIVATNWSDGAVVGSNPLHFLMQSNLTLSAVFVDTNRPVVTVSAPQPNQRSSYPIIVANGTAGDNVAVGHVWWRLNGGPWASARGTTAWVQLLRPRAGSNTLEVCAEDTAGNHSRTGMVQWVYASSPTNLVRSVQVRALRGLSHEPRLAITGGVSRHIGLEVSTNLLDWATAGVFTNATGTVELACPEMGSEPAVFYRAWALP
jgi:hypothetical protein